MPSCHPYEVRARGSERSRRVRFGTVHFPPNEAVFFTPSRSFGYLSNNCSSRREKRERCHTPHASKLPLTSNEEQACRSAQVRPSIRLPAPMEYSGNATRPPSYRIIQDVR